MLKYSIGIGIFLMGLMTGPIFGAYADTSCDYPQFQTQDTLQHFNPPRDGSDRWLAWFEQARKQNNPRVAGYALVRYLLAQHNQVHLTRQERSLLKSLRNILEHTESENLYRTPRMLSAWLKEQGLALATVLNMDPFLRRQNSLGQPYPTSDRRATAMIKIMQDVVWSWSPFILRLVPSGWAYWTLRSKNFKRWKAHVQSESFWTQLPIKRDEFTQRAIADTFPDARHFRARYHLSRHGTLLRPMILGILWMLMGVDPVILATNQTIEPDYAFDDLVDDVQTELGISVEGQSIAVIVDEDFILKMSDLFEDPNTLDTNPMTSITEIEKLSKRVPVFQMMTPSSMEELNVSLKLSRDANVIFILAHGQPGDFVIGNEKLRDHLHQIDARGFKENVTLIFISCNFGDIAPTHAPEEDQEPWIGLSRQILQNTSGKAIAAINSMYVHIKTKENSEPKNTDPDIKILKRQLMISGIVGILNSTGLKHGIAYLLWQDYRKRPFGNQKGFRMYDAATGRVYFFKSR